jgi:hypothetical protein
LARWHGYTDYWDFLFKGLPVSLVIVVASIPLMSFTILPAGVIYYWNHTGGLPAIRSPRFGLDVTVYLNWLCVFPDGYIETISPPEPCHEE